MDPLEMHPLRRARVLQKMSQAELAEAAGVTQQAVSKIERGLQTGSTKTLKKLAATLDTTVDEIIGEPLEAPKAPAPQLREQLAALAPDEIRTLLNGVWGTWTMDRESNIKSMAIAKRKCKDLGVTEEELREALMYIAPLAAEQLQRSQREYERSQREREEALASMEKQIKEGA